MRLLRRSDDGEFHLTNYLGDKATIPPYAILSHTWGADTAEVTFEDLRNGGGKHKPGYNKIQFCAEQAGHDGLRYFWIDTCCIDKANKAELAQAINSMFRWYRDATRCYVYLSDVSSPASGCSQLLWESDFRKSRWFTRGWTLQELLAPGSVEFYSQEGNRLGDKTSLKQPIREITGISDAALEGTPLTQVSVNERFSWNQHRETKLEEDKAYSLLGIFDVYILPIYGEGASEAFRRLMDEINTFKQCIQDLRLTDPRADKKRIEDTKGGLLRNSYHWILDNSDFQRWRDDKQSQLLWVKGDPGKGKTMLLCGIINELGKLRAKLGYLSYFFCQATDTRINSATAVLRGLLYMLVDQQPSLVSHIRKKYDYAGKALFEDANAWVALTEIFASVLQDPSLSSTCLIIDALDECTLELPKLLRFVAQQSASSRVKWIVSSRNWSVIEEQLNPAGHKVMLSLELNPESVSTAVNHFIKQRVSQLVQQKRYDNKTRDAVLEHLTTNADDTFLWVALVCQTLEKIPRWNVLKKLNVFPPGLDSLYERMMQQICSSDDADLCKQILASAAIVYRPITLRELASLVELLEDIVDLASIQEIIGLCGSFLTLREGTVYFVHQSAKEFLFANASGTIFPSGTEDVHFGIVSKSLQAMSGELHRDMYGLGALGYPAEQIKQPNPDPLAASRYSCIYWIDHLHDSAPNTSASYTSIIQDRGAVDIFLRQKYLYWLEALSLCKSMSKGVISMAKLEALIQACLERAVQPHVIRANMYQGRTTTPLTELVQDASRFVMSHKGAIEESPLQAYVSAMLFSPVRSPVRRLFEEEEPKWITIKPAMTDSWSACLQTLEGHSSYVNSVAFSHDSTRLASASNDRTIKIWDASSGMCLKTLEGHSSDVHSVAFSHDSTRLASASNDRTIKIWDASSGICLQTLEGHSSYVHSVAFSHDSTRLASASNDRTIKIWDASSGMCLKTLKGHSSYVHSVAFSHDSTRLASASDDSTIKIWDASSGMCLQTLEGHSGNVNSVAFSHDSTRLAFSHDSTRLASASNDRTIKIWDASNGMCLKTLEGHSRNVNSVAFSHDSTRLASASWDRTIKIWDASSGMCLQTLEGHSSYVNSVAFSHDSTRLASASGDRTIKIWDASSGMYLQTLEGHSSDVRSVAFSHDSTRLASASSDRTIKIWDASSGICLKTLEGHSSDVHSVAFSHDSTQLASASDDRTIKIWDASSGICLKTLEGHSSYVNSVAFSHDSTRLASASSDRTIKIWDASSGICLKTLEGHSSYVNSVAFSHDSTRLASASDDSTIKIWDASSGICLQTLNVGAILDIISFDAAGAYLHTNIGLVDVSASVSSNEMAITMLQHPQYQGGAINSAGTWIVYKLENVLWLPSEYRPSCSAVLGKMISIGVGSGKVWMCSFEGNDAL